MKKNEKRQTELISLLVIACSFMLIVITALTARVIYRNWVMQAIMINLILFLFGFIFFLFFFLF